MKPLTIEELKALSERDWVWIEVKTFEYACRTPQVKGYYQKEDFCGAEKDLVFLGRMVGVTSGFQYADYGKQWIAYKNKECAESNGEWVVLPCELGQLLYAVEDNSIHEYYAAEINVRDDGRFVFETPKLFPHRLQFGEDMFVDKSQAEARLKELRKEGK